MKRRGEGQGEGRVIVAIASVLLLSCPPSPQCQNGRTDGTETDVDCGGACAPCAPTRLCLDDVDCASGVCTLNRCVAPTCDDGVENGTEEDVDCGGPCVACVGGCVRNTDCGATGVCIDGQCTTGGCAPPLQVCGALCIDPRVDPQNCGGCNQPCPTAQACIGGACRAVCGGGTRECGQTCVDVGSDPLNCGACRRACGATDVCVGGNCFPRCPPGQTDCGGLCVSTDRDPAHCGGCGRPCVPGTGCVGGQCTPGCPSPPLLSCDGGAACVDPRFDPGNCGGCGVTCPPVPHAKAACTPAEGCGRSACDPGFADCDAGTNDGCEAELGVDSQNCGACGRLCFGSDACIMGRCCGPLPQGTYLMTCTACEACNGVLTCLCQDAMANPVPAMMPLIPCPTGVLNCNGVLQCGGC